MKKILFLAILLASLVGAHADTDPEGSGLLSINGQDTDVPGAKKDISVEETCDLLFKNIPIPGVVYYDQLGQEIFRENIDVFTKIGRDLLYQLLNIINASPVVNGQLASHKETGEILIFDESSVMEQRAESLVRKYGKIKHVKFSDRHPGGSLLAVKNDLSGASGWVFHKNLDGNYLTLDLSAFGLGEYLLVRVECSNLVSPNLVFSLSSLGNSGNTLAEKETEVDVDPNLQAVLDAQQKNNGGTKEVFTTPDGKTVIVLTVNANPIAYAGGSDAKAYVTGATTGGGGTTEKVVVTSNPHNGQHKVVEWGTRPVGLHNTGTTEHNTQHHSCSHTSCDGYQNTGGNVYVQTYPTNRNGRPKSDPASIVSALFNSIDAGANVAQTVQMFQGRWQQRPPVISGGGPFSGQRRGRAFSGN